MLRNRSKSLVSLQIWFGALSLLILLTPSQGLADQSSSLFNGRDLSGWKMSGNKHSGWFVGTAAVDPGNPTKLIVTTPGTELVGSGESPNLVSEAAFGDCLLELEFMVPKGSNSGVKMMSIYEIQILDSFGKAVPDPGDCGAVYKESAPKVNACKAPGKWQRLSIDFRAPKFDASGKKTANARFVKVLLNGQLIQENVEVAHGTNVSKNAAEHPRGEILLQGDHGPVAFRNIKITALN
jgi:3-keto-disaccharide hydrolase